jgi:hypothetical protein
MSSRPDGKARGGRILLACDLRATPPAEWIGADNDRVIHCYSLALRNVRPIFAISLTRMRLEPLHGGSLVKRRRRVPFADSHRPIFSISRRAPARTIAYSFMQVFFLGNRAISAKAGLEGRACTALPCRPISFLPSLAPMGARKLKCISCIHFLSSSYVLPALSLWPVQLAMPQIRPLAPNSTAQSIAQRSIAQSTAQRSTAQRLR